MPVTIRDIESGDAEEVVAMIARSDEDDAEEARAYYAESFADTSEKTHDFVAVDESCRILGAGGIMADDGEGNGIWWLSWWYVDPDHQGSGIGSALMAKSLDRAREKKARKVYVDVSALEFYAEARRFYASHGFVEEAVLRDFYAEGEDMILMANVLKQEEQTNGD